MKIMIIGKKKNIKRIVIITRFKREKKRNNNPTLKKIANSDVLHVFWQLTYIPTAFQPFCKDPDDSVSPESTSLLRNFKV